MIREFMLESRFSRAQSIGMMVSLSYASNAESLLTGLFRGLGTLVVAAVLVEGYRAWDKRYGANK